MNTTQYLFPKRLTRRDFLATTATAAAAASAGSVAHAADPLTLKPEPVRIGSGKFTYTLDEGWGKLPTGMSYGLGCGIVVDSKDRIYVTSRSISPCVAVFSREGKLLETWSKDFGDKVGYTPEQVMATAHCIYWSKEGRNEFLYFTENVGGPEKNLGKRVYKTDLKGKVLYTIGNVDKESSTSQKFTWTNPTDVAVAPNGDIYIVDGYGSQIVSRFDKNFKHLKTIGGRSTKKGPDAEHGLFNTCHGVWVNTLRKTPEVYIADRANGRYEVYDLELNYVRTISGDFVRNPCCFYQHKDHLYVPDLGSLVVILDKNDQPVARLGDGRGTPKEQFEHGAKDKFTTPHALCVDSRGDLYVLEWVPYGRVRKFQHTPVA
ncbi:MAG: twin-arginine translocation signal domain-containing protein [Verrucomicrobia bacterium]|nr:twin-arginine translocation signal domain-containing protein [Verrucomicrobiota bacterium]